MTKKPKLLLIGFAVACFVIGGGAYWAFYTARHDKTSTATISKPVSMVDHERPDFALKDISDKRHDIKQWDGKVILLNFWATWCPPCRHEIPDFIKLYNKYKSRGFLIVGVALDTKQNAIDFLDPMNINYPILVAEKTGIDLTQKYGNNLGVLPYSVIIDRKGIIRHTVSHAMTEAQAEQLIKPLL